MNSCIGVAIVGAGAMGKETSKCIRDNFSDARLQMICDINEKTAKAAKQDIGFQEYCTDYNDAINDPDVQAVVVAVPPGFHRDVVVAAAKAKKHILCEKPISVEQSHADEMISVCKEAGVVLRVGYHFRFAESRLKIRELLLSGTIGRPVFWREHLPLYYERQKWILNYTLGGGRLFEYSHSIDFACYTFGKPQWVFAQCLNFNNKQEIKSPDSFNCTIKFSSGDCYYTSGFGTLPVPGDKTSKEIMSAIGGGHRIRENDIVGPKGAIYAGLNKEQQTEMVVCVNPATDDQHKEVYPWGGWGGYSADNTDPHVSKFKAFFQEIQKGKKDQRNSGEQAKQTLDIIHAALESSRTGKVISLKCI